MMRNKEWGYNPSIELRHTTHKDPGPGDPALVYPWKGIVLDSAKRSVGVTEWWSDAGKPV